MKQINLIIAGLAVVFTAQISNAQTLSNGLVAKYVFNGNAADSSGQGNNGQKFGAATYVADRFGCANRAINFDGINAAGVNIPVSPSFSIANSDYSMSFWVKYQPTARGVYPVIIYNGNTIYEWFQMQGWGTANEIVFGGKSGTEESSSIIYSGINIKDGTWHHIVGIRKNINQLSLYIDATLVASGVFSDLHSIDTYDNSNPNYFVLLGYQYGGYYNDGSLDDLYFYNRALTPADVQALFTETQACAAVVATSNATAAAGSFRLAPNPTANGVCRIIAAQDYRDLTVSLTDLTGKVLRTQQVASIAAQQSIELPLQGIAAGSYYVSLRTAEGIQTQQLIVMEN